MSKQYLQCKDFAYLKIVSMIRKYHNHKLQTTPWHREEEPLNRHETPGNLCCKFSWWETLPTRSQRDDCKLESTLGTALQNKDQTLPTPHKQWDQQ